MKIIDLLNKRANGEKIKKFKFDGSLFELDDDGVYRQKNGSSLSDYCFIEECLNDEIYEVEIIEDNKKIKEIKSLNNVGNSSDLGEFKDKQQLNNHILKNKINEITRKLNEVLNDED